MSTREALLAALEFHVRGAMDAAQKLMLRARPRGDEPETKYWRDLRDKIAEVGEEAGQQI